MPVTGIVATSGHHTEAVTDWTGFIRQLCADNVDFEDVKIGGPGVIVEVDETKLGKRKYHRGHRVDGVWVMAGVERSTEKKVFLMEVEDRKIETIVKVLETHILPGSILFTDGWKAYSKAAKILGFEHHIVKHNLHFNDPITGVHTNTVEGVNNGIKHLIKPRNRCKKNINDNLYYYLWRKKNKNNL